MGWTPGRVLYLNGIGVCVSFKFSAGTSVQFCGAPTYLNQTLLALEMWFKYTQELCNPP